MHAVNIHRTAASSEELVDWLARQRKVSRLYYFRHLASRLLRGQWKSFWAGVEIRREVFTRMFERDWQLAQSRRTHFEPAASVGKRSEVVEASLEDPTVSWTKRDSTVPDGSTH
jgi:hypothetical protein